VNSANALRFEPRRPAAHFLQSSPLRQRKQTRQIGLRPHQQTSPVFPNSLLRKGLSAAFAKFSKVGAREKGDKISTFNSLRRNDLRRIAKNNP
jgi:hypothetical protein